MSYQDDAIYGDRNDVTYSETLETPNTSLTWVTHAAGAIASLALVAGVGVWGYSLLMRDVSGIPIVRAMDGEMRVRPDDPGGNLARHQGLAVNEVAAEGGASAPADRIVLAPQPVRLTEEDLPMDDEARALVEQAIAAQVARPDSAAPAASDASEDVAARIVEAAENGEVDALVAALTEGMTPLDPAPSAQEAAVVPASLEVPAALAQTGLQVSIRPKPRPAKLVPAALSRAAPAPDVAAPVDPDTLPAGTRLVQLGAYESIEVAQVEWAKFSARFQELMAGKRQIVQQASSGGRTFYRLRAMGFDDLSQARRFCSALQAEGADCIPVSTR